MKKLLLFGVAATVMTYGIDAGVGKGHQPAVASANNGTTAHVTISTNATAKAFSSSSSQSSTNATASASSSSKKESTKKNMKAKAVNNQHATRKES